MSHSQDPAGGHRPPSQDSTGRISHGERPWALLYALSQLDDEPSRPWEHSLVEEIASFLGADYVVLTTLDEDRLMPVASHGFPHHYRLEPFSRQLCAGDSPSIEEPESSLCHGRVPWPWPVEHSMDEGICVALRTKERLWGALMLGQRARQEDENEERRDFMDLGALFYGALAAQITATLHSRALARELEERSFQLSHVLENISDALMIFDLEGHVVLYNTRAAGMVGNQQWHTLGPEFHRFRLLDRHGRPIEREEWPLLKAVATGEGSTNKEYLLDFGEFKRYVVMNVIPIADEHGETRSFVATARDITDQREEEQRKDDFLSVASHELRGPLTPLTGLLQLIRKQVENQSLPDLALMRRAENQTRRLRRLIDDLLDISRIETGRLHIGPKSTDLVVLMQRIMEPWTSGTNGHLFRLKLHAPSIITEVDPDRLEQVVTNLIDNAVKHGKPGGHVTVELTREDDLAVITVTDEGDGIAPETLARIFERLYHNQQPSSASRTSMGLGLYISREIVQAHGGKICIESSPGAPTLVRVELPLP